MRRGAAMVLFLNGAVETDFMEEKKTTIPGELQGLDVVRI